MDPTPQYIPFIDIHSHLTSDHPGVFRIFNLFLQDFDPVSSLPEVFSCGLHPWHIQQCRDLDSFHIKLEDALQQPGMIALGEAGLDKIIKVSMELQSDIFRKQVLLSEKYRKPMIIHCVRAFPELLAIRNETEASQPWILHGFNSNAEMALDLVKKGIYISAGMRLLKNPEKFRDVVQRIPSEFLFVETDDDETDISFIYQDIASQSGIQTDELKEIIYQNFKRIFKL